MSDQIKISPSLQDAQAFMAECLEFVTQDEPFVLDFNDSFGSYVQAIRDDADQICVEISGPESIQGELGSEAIAKLAELGWGMPRSPEADTPNFWREYPEDADFKQVAKDAILGVAVAFPDAKFISTMVDSIMNMDEAVELIEQGEKVFVQPVEKFYSAWQNYQAASFHCSKCKKTVSGVDLQNDFQGLVLTLRCPKCHRKLLHLSVEASIEEVKQFAAEGSPTAIEHLEIMAKYEAEKEAGNAPE